MSEHITHLAVAEDSARLVGYNPAFSARIKTAMEKYPEALRLGSTTRSGDTFILPLLTTWKNDWQENDRRAEQMAYIIGWAGHLAADRTFKPVFRITDLAYYTRGYPGPSHASIYHDTVMFEQVYQSGQATPFHPSALQKNIEGHAAADYVPVNRVESALASNFAGNLASIRTFLPQAIEDWNSQWRTLDGEKQKFYVGIERYTDAYHNSDPSRRRQYIIEANFYNPNDPIIALARSIQQGEKSSIKLSTALENTDNQSLYAQSLKLGYDFLMACSDYFEGNISLDEAKKQMRTFEPHTQSLDYYVNQVQKED